MDIPTSDVNLEDLWVVVSTGYMLDNSIAAGPYTKKETAEGVMATVKAAYPNLSYCVTTVDEFIQWRYEDGRHRGERDA